MLEEIKVTSKKGQVKVQVSLAKEMTFNQIRTIRARFALSKTTKVIVDGRGNNRSLFAKGGDVYDAEPTWLMK